MMKRAPMIIGAMGAGLVGLKLASDAAAKANAATVGQGGQASSALDALAAAGAYNPLQLVLSGATGRRVQSALTMANVRAALDALAWAEGTASRPNSYAVVYAYAFTITDFSAHPRALGWRGVSLASLGASYAGKVSTAAGRYQINYPTWTDAARALGLSDFSPASQDAAAVWIMDQCGALDDIEAGRFDQALPELATRWASIPGGNSGQAQRRAADLVAAYQQAGGMLA